MALPKLFEGRLSVPVMAAPMFLISNPDLVLACCRAGIVGSFPALNARPIELLETWLERITSALAPGDAPFAVNLIVHKSNTRLEQDLALVVKYRVPVVITSLGARADVNEAVHAYGGIVFHDVIDDRFARKAVERGADGLIAVAAGAGGHAGTQSPFALVQEIRDWFDGPLALSGAIANGRSIAAARALGADLAYIGSAFIATDEADADPRYKRMVVESGAGDIVYSSFFTGVLGNYLAPSIVAAGLDPAALAHADPSKMDFATLADGKTKAWRDIWGAGQGIGAVKDIVPAAALVARLKAEYEAALAALQVK
ncbi:NAD(P)H-dependent flavin oxidoreductase [Acidomonas methanolica]|uniref:2-nitropropane dioxygenase n=1 Tax=Acidomonas methanolica NBRC 104435 TaxID=1231351 RepID=A0A023D1D0_ACIMT|nr:nitronate monooxygenase family protein [Acidomonas methanolica]MBU2654146.1 nitronate monooxygenase family protein [Acidomonas methanolica]TCS30625.1 nitronate monooxygenase [Acidomonas methanolica]GAJ27611.1 2-nitropropane dioxygenase [Acidomonas methanolica NBRC 104435]GBQ54158.1 dioxygenase [Acidomonas methanolica]GEK98815.1 2-nitropropane dioxygenase [Acidomonas methanolica NBRC 104435]